LYHYEMDEMTLKRERAAARDLRNSRWWQNRIAASPLCHYCQVQITNKADATMDHIVPLVRGGRSVKGNIVVACKSCNNAKKDQLVMDWPSYMTDAETRSET
jgi:5-methylcytosine-specific restriction protein A